MRSLLNGAINGALVFNNGHSERERKLAHPTYGKNVRNWLGSSNSHIKSLFQWKV